MHVSEHEPQGTEAPSIFENDYDKEVFLDNWKSGSLKTMKAIFAIGAILLFSDLLALSMANTLNGSSIIIVFIVPLIYAALGVFARTRPLLSIIIASVLFLAIIAINIYAFGTKSLLSGLIIKAFVVYFILTGLNHAREAEAAKKKLDAYL